MQKNKSGWCFFSALFVVVVSVVVARCCDPHLAWVVVMGLLIVFMLVLGTAISGRWLGILITEQNVMSLARVQTVVWTVIIISAYFVIAMVRIKNQDKLEKTPATQVSATPTPAPTSPPSASPATQSSASISATPSPPPSISPPDPLNITLSNELLALIGITATALVGAPLIAATKKSQTPAQSAVRDTAQELVRTNNVPQSVQPIAQQAAMRVIEQATAQMRTMATPDDKAIAEAEAKAKPEADAAKADAVAKEITMSAEGALFKNPSINDASFSDMFQGDEVGNAAHVDLGKVQMFYFTAIVALAYSVAIWSALSEHKLYAFQFSFPLLSQGMVALLGISNAGYLANKGVDHTEKGQ